MRIIILGLTAALLATAVLAEATHEAAIKQRQAAFKEMKTAVAEIKDAMKVKDFSMAGNSAELILTNAKLVTELFPAESYKGDTRAKKKIWKNRFMD